MPGGGKGKTPLHNKKPKSVKKEEDEDDKANKERLREEKAANEALKKQLSSKGKGPLNTGQQGIKHSKGK